MFGRRKHPPAIPEEEQRELRQVKRRLDRVEVRMGAIETELRLVTRKDRDK